MLRVKQKIFAPKKILMSEEVNDFGIPLPLEEMARLGTESGYDFRIYSEPLGNPSFHILGDDFEIVVTIKDLKILEVKRSSKSKRKFQKGDSLSGELLKSTMSLMNRTVPNSMMTIKQFLVITWNANNPGFQIRPSYIQW